MPPNLTVAACIAGLVASQQLQWQCNALWVGVVAVGAVWVAVADGSYYIYACAHGAL